MQILLILLVIIFLGGTFIYLWLNNQPKNINSIKDLSEVFPIQTIEDDCVVNGNGDITIGYRINMHDVFLLSKPVAKQIHDGFVDIMKLLPDGTIIHKQDFFYEDIYSNNESIDNIIQKENMNNYIGRPILNSYSYLYLTFSNKAILTKEVNSTLQVKPNYIFNQPFKNLNERKAFILQDINSFENRLKDIAGTTIIRMNTNDLSSASYDFINMSYENPCENGYEQVVNPIKIDEDGQLQIGNKYISVISLIEEGAKLEPLKTPTTALASTYNNGISFSNEIKSKASLVFPICLGLPINHIVNTTIEIINTQETLADLQKQCDALNYIAPFNIQIENKQKDITQFIEAITSGGGKNNKHGGFQLCRTAVNVIIDDCSKKELKNKISHVKTAFLNMNSSRVYVENFDTANLLFASIGGNASANYRGFVNTTQQAVCYINKESLVMSDPSGLIYTDRFGKPIVMELWNAKGCNNRNQLIFGPSGSGKSFYLNDYINQLLLLDTHVVMVDIGYSYKKLCALNGGLHFDASNSDLLTFNIFLCRQNHEGKYIYKNSLRNQGESEADSKESVNDKLNYIVAILSNILKGPGEEFDKAETSLLQKSIAKFYDYVNDNDIFPDFNAYYDYLDIFNKDELNENTRTYFNVQKMKIIYEKYYKDGAYEKFLNSKKNIDIINEKFIVFDLEAVEKNPDIFSLLCLIIVELSAEKSRQLEGVKKAIIFDEAVNFLVEPKTGPYIGYLFRTFRKKDGTVIIATQNPEFLENAPSMIQRSITINCDTRIMLSHKGHEDSYTSIQKILSFTDLQIEQLDSLVQTSTYREILMSFVGRTVILRIEMSDFAASVYDSRQTEVVEVNRLLKKYGSLQSAITNYVANKKKLQGNVA